MRLCINWGWNPTDLPPSYAALATVIDDATAKLDALADPPTPEQIVDLLASVKKAYQAIRGCSRRRHLASIRPRFWLKSASGCSNYFSLNISPQPRHASIASCKCSTSSEPNSCPASAGRSSFVRTKFKWAEILKIVPARMSYPKSACMAGEQLGLNASRAIDHIAELLVALHFQYASNAQPIGWCGPTQELVALRRQSLARR